MYADCANVRKRVVRPADNARRRSAVYDRSMGDSRKFFLRDWRKAKGLSQDALAAAVETTKGYVSEMERGVRPYSQRWLEAFSAALGVRPEDLLSPPPDGLADGARRFGEARPGGKPRSFDADLMARCIETAFAVIAKNRDLRSPAAMQKAAEDAAEAALEQYFAYQRLIADEGKTAA